MFHRDAGADSTVLRDVANPCAMKHNPCALENPCVAGMAIDPRQIARPADIPPFSGVKRSKPVEEGGVFWADEIVQFRLLVPMQSRPLAWDSREPASLAAHVLDVE